MQRPPRASTWWCADRDNSQSLIDLDPWSAHDFFAQLCARSEHAYGQSPSRFPPTDGRPVGLLRQRWANRRDRWYDFFCEEAQRFRGLVVGEVTPRK
jgi:hypothetical protein